MPAVNGKFPEKITSSILDTKSINEEEDLLLKDDYLNYTKEDGRLKITLENKMSEDKSYVAGKGKTRILLTSVYTNVDNISAITKKGFRAILDVNAKETLVSSNKEKTYNFKKDIVIKDKLGELVSFDMKLDKTNISKGIFYKNIYKEVKEKVSLKNTVALNVSSTDIVKGIRVLGQAPYYDDNTNLQERNITVSKVEVSKTEFKNILGEDGSITIKSNGKKIGEISKVTKEENGKYTFQLPEKVQALEYVTSKTVNEGDLVLNEYYEMNSTVFNMEAFQKFQTLNFEKETFVQDLDENGKTKGELSIKRLKNTLKLDNILTEINLKINKDELSTVVKNENVEFVIQLNNDKLTSDIYGNTYFEMILPKELTNVEIKDTNMIYGEGLKLQSIKKEKVGQNIVLKIYVTGLQKEKNNGHLTNGTNIVINTDITIFEETPTKTVEYIVKYKNDLATNSTNIKKGILKLKAPTGVVVANRVKNFNNSGNEVTTIKQGNKDATLELNGSAKQAQEQIMLINNLNQELKNAVILGRIPSPGVKDLKQNIDLGSNISTILTKGITNVNGRTDFDIYYSDLVNANTTLNPENRWTKNPKDLKTVKSYMIVFKRNITPQEVLKFNLNLEIPANLDYNKSAIIANSVIYMLEGQGNKYFASYADMIRLTTG